MLPPHFWSREEEILVVKGVQIFGYQWNRISQTLLRHVHAGAIKNKFYKMMGLGEIQMKQDPQGRAYPILSQRQRHKSTKVRRVNDSEIVVDDSCVIDLLSRLQELCQKV